MVMCACKSVGLFCLVWSLTFADEGAYRESKREKRWDSSKSTPERSNEKSNHDNDSIQPRFLPFTASFSLSAAGLANNAHSLSVGGGSDGISFSQSTSQSGASIGNDGSGISASQSSSFAAGLSGISGADSNSFSLKHPAFGGNSQANSNSFALGQATAAANGNVANGQASSGAQAGVGSAHSSASSGAIPSGGVANSKGQGFQQGRPVWTSVAPNHQVGGVYSPNGGHRKLHVSQGNRGWTQRLPSRRPIQLDVNLDDDRWQRRRPEVVVSTYRGHRQGATDPQKKWPFDEEISPPGGTEAWTQSPQNGPNPGMWSQVHQEGSNKPNLQISGASASSSAGSNTPGGFAQGHSSSHGSVGPNGPSSWTNNRVQTSGNAQGQAQGGAAAVGHNYQGSTQGSFSSGAIAANSQDNGSSYGNAASGIRGQSSRGRVTSLASGNTFVQGTAHAGSFDHVKFPDTENPQNPSRDLVVITQSHLRNDQQSRKSRDPVHELFTEIGDTVSDLFDI